MTEPLMIVLATVGFICIGVGLVALVKALHVLKKYEKDENE